MATLFKRLADVFSDLAHRKTEAARARQLASTTGAETPREVYLNACQSIADEISPDGFKYSRSGPHCTKTAGEFRFKIAFQSSRNNVAGVHVTLWMHANVYSSRLKSWRLRQSRPLRTDELVAGGMVHNLWGEHAMIQWELAHQQQRPEVISSAVGFIRSEVFSYFELMSDPEAVLARLDHSAIGAFDVGSSVEFALCFGGHSKAQSVLNRFLEQRPDLYVSAQATTDTFRVNGFPEHRPSSYAEQIAWVRSAYDLA